MGRAHHGLELVERMAVLGLVHPGVHAQRGDVPGLEAAVEGVLVVQTAARHVDQADARLHHGDLLVGDHVEGLFGARRVDGDVVRLAQQLLELLLALHVEVAEAGVGDVGVVGDDPHGEATGPLGDQAADAAQPDDAQGLGVELAALELPAPPLAALDEAVGPGDVAAAGQEQAQGVLGGGDDVALRRVADDDALLRWRRGRRCCRAPNRRGPRCGGWWRRRGSSCLICVSLRTMMPW